MTTGLAFDPEAAASAIVRLLRPGSVLAAGTGGALLADALRRRGVDAVAAAADSRHPGYRFDVMACAGAVDGAAAEIAKRSRQCASCLLLDGSGPDWLRLLVPLGFAPDPRFVGSSLEPAAALLRRSEAPPSAEVLAVFAEVLRLRSEMAAHDAERKLQMEELRQALASLSTAVFERAERQRDVLETLVVRQHDIVEELLHSRTWRTLCAAGALLLKVAGMARSLESAALRVWEMAGRETVRVSVDEVALAPLSADALHVRGWALARSGIERVEIDVDGSGPAEARIGLPRPDVAAAYPRIGDAGCAGFEVTVAGFDPAHASHWLHVRAISRKGAEREIMHTVDPRRTEYDCWIAEFERRDPALVSFRLQCLKSQPLISIIVPVHRPEVLDLQRAIASVRTQSYPCWELCLAMDGPAPAEIVETLRAAGAADSRIRFTALPAQSGISAATNAALALAHGEYVGFLDDADELAPDALLLIAEAIQKHGGPGFLYSDEDKITVVGRRYEPFFKPDWSPDLLLSENYVCHFLVARRDLVASAGGLRTEYDGSQDHDLVLRLSSLTSTIVHIPAVLYHWRAAAGSAALASGAKPHALNASRRAVAEHLRRTGRDARVDSGAVDGRLRVRYAIPPGSRVTIIIPSGGKIGELRTCLESIRKTAYRDYEVLVIDNSRGSRVQRLVRTFARSGLTIRCLDWSRRPFNYAAMNNAASRVCTTPLLLFLNDDTRAIVPEWLEAMVELGAGPDAGAVGAKLLYPDGRIQHAGVVLGLFQHAGHAFRGLDGAKRHYFDLPDVIRNVSAVTGACMLVRAAAFWEAGGFDESRFPVSFNDVDLCLRLTKLGYKVLYTPHAVLQHHESLSRRGRGLLRDPLGVAALQIFARDAIAADPYYSPNLTRTSEDYSLRRRCLEGTGCATRETTVRRCAGTTPGSCGP